jgi:hypothetical protein
MRRAQAHALARRQPERSVLYVAFGGEMAALWQSCWS